MNGPKNALSRELMRRKVIKFLCNNIVFVGLHVGWTLAALQHRVSAEFVIDISVKPGFETLTYNLAHTAKFTSTTNIYKICGAESTARSSLANGFV